MKIDDLSFPAARGAVAETAGSGAGQAWLVRSFGGLQRQRVLLLTGLAGSPNLWRPYAYRADQSQELWVADLPWTGLGVPDWSCPGGSPTKAIGAALAAVPGRVEVIVAHSFAANALLEFLVDRVPSQLRAVVLVSPFYRTSPEAFDWADISYYLNEFHRILSEGLRVSTRQESSAEMLHEMALRLRDRIGPYGWMRFFDAYLRTPFLDVSKLNLPVLVIGGERDFAAPVAEVRTLAARLPAARSASSGSCGHFCMTEDPAWFARTVVDFLSVVAPPLPVPIVDLSPELL